MKLITCLLIIVGAICAKEDKKFDKRDFLTSAVPAIEPVHEVVDGDTEEVIVNGNEHGLRSGTLGLYPALRQKLSYIQQPVLHASPVGAVESVETNPQFLHKVAQQTISYGNGLEVGSQNPGFAFVLGHSAYGAPVLHASAPLVQSATPVIYASAPIVHHVPIVTGPVLAKTIISAVVPAVAVRQNGGYGLDQRQNLPLGLGSYANLRDAKYFIHNI